MTRTEKIVIEKTAGEKTVRGFPKISFWRTVVAVIFAAGIYSMYARFALGLKVATNLTDPQPWGLWVGLGTLCGVGLSAGGFAIATAVYILGLERYRPILRTSVLISFLGYSTVCVGMLYELGIPWRIWHPIVMWNRHSVLFEVSWCVMLYTTVLALEFSPALVEKIPWTRARQLYLRWHHSILIALVMAGTLLSSMHQSFLGGLYLITKGKLDPLWYSPYLTTMFYLSAIPAGLAVTIMAIYLCVRSLNVQVDMNILSDVSRVIAPMLAIYAVFRAVDLFHRDALGYMWMWREATGLFWLEILLLVAAPLVLLNLEKVRNTPMYLYWTSAVIVAGFMTNRLNVAITGVQTSGAAYYIPKWTEFAATFATVAAAVVAFRYAVIYLDILPKNGTRQMGMIPDATAHA
ncbi:MAG TPA: NrfD/PsrC family molybdoenzyme membrane anchor subunit [Candidatus Sulfotelmatobacter sp.]|nr:NrfD/PsrC family molybdoenzyme membrane anchor subunit [Candidatus Sulfotelmatobacter sp.]